MAILDNVVNTLFGMDRCENCNCYGKLKNVDIEIKSGEEVKQKINMNLCNTCVARMLNALTTISKSINKEIEEKIEGENLEDESNIES